MRRREFITLIGGAALAWPHVARAQQAERVRRVGVLMAVTADDAEAQARIAAFVRGLQQLGWSIGKNIQVDYRLAGIDADTLRKYAGELVALAPDVILAQSSPSIAALLQATRTVPIVFTLIADPVGAGYVDSLAHPGGNATGFTVASRSPSRNPQTANAQQLSRFNALMRNTVASCFPSAATTRRRDCTGDAQACHGAGADCRDRTRA